MTAVKAKPDYNICRSFMCKTFLKLNDQVGMSTCPTLVGTVKVSCVIMTRVDLANCRRILKWDGTFGRSLNTTRLAARNCVITV